MLGLLSTIIRRGGAICQESVTHEKIALAYEHNWELITSISAREIARTTKCIQEPFRGNTQHVGVNLRRTSRHTTWPLCSKAIKTSNLNQNRQRAFEPRRCSLSTHKPHPESTENRPRIETQESQRRKSTTTSPEKHKQLACEGATKWFLCAVFRASGIRARLSEVSLGVP